jgi:hypothetical protein
MRENTAKREGLAMGKFRVNLETAESEGELNGKKMVNGSLV